MRFPHLTVIAVCALGSMLLASCTQRVGKSVLYIVPSLDDEAYVLQLEAAEQEARKYPQIAFEFTAGTSRDVGPEFIAKIESAVTRGMQLIIIDSDGAAEQLGPALTQARQAGVKIVVNAHPIPRFTADVHIEPDPYAGAVPAGQFMAQHLHPGDEIAVLRCAIGNATMDARFNGFKEGLGESGIQIVATGETRCDPLEARKLMENWITAFPHLKGLFSDTDIALVGAIEALKAANLDLVVVGHDGQTRALEMMSKGEIIDATVIYPAKKLGSLAVDAAAHLLNGEAVSPHIVLPPEGLITPENLKDHLK